MVPGTEQPQLLWVPVSHTLTVKDFSLRSYLNLPSSSIHTFQLFPKDSRHAPGFVGKHGDWQLQPAVTVKCLCDASKRATLGFQRGFRGWKERCSPSVLRDEQPLCQDREVYSCFPSEAGHFRGEGSPNGMIMPPKTFAGSCSLVQQPWMAARSILKSFKVL